MNAAFSTVLLNRLVSKPPWGFRALKDLNRTVSDAASAPVFRMVLMLMFCSQIVIVQALPLLGERAANPVASVVSDVLGRQWALGMAAILGTALFLSAVTKKWTAPVALAHAANQLIFGYVAGKHDPYVGIQLGVYAAIATFVAVSSLRWKVGE